MKNGLTGLPWKRLYKIGKPFWVSEMKWVALAHLGALLLLLFVNAQLAKYASVVAGRFMTAFEKRHQVDFDHNMWLWVGLLVLVIPPFQIAYGTVRTRLALTWRQWMSTEMFQGYLTNRTYLWMIRNPHVDNPDQRMAQDPDSFANTSVGLFFAVVDSLTYGIIFSMVLWHLSPMLTVTVFVYALVGSIAVVYIGRSMPSLNFMQMKTEADLRFTLAEARREAVSVAMYRAESIVFKQATTRLGLVITTLKSIMWANVRLQLFTNPFNALVPLIPAYFVAPLYFRHQVEWGHFTQATIAFGVVFGAATILIGQFNGISNFVAIINRLGSFREAVEEGQINRLPPGKHIEYVEGDRIAFEHVTVLTPDMVRPVILDLSLDIPSGVSVYVTGPDGSGKSAVVNTIAGTWIAGSGKVTIPTPSKLMFLTPVPYMPVMTLRQALCYEGDNLCPDDTRLLQILNLVNLPDLMAKAGGLDVEQNWREILSVSEQQRLGLARIIWRKPQFVLLDEVPSTLEEENERMLYSVLAGLNATVLTAGSAARLVKYHTHVLELLGNGQWKWCLAKDYQPKVVLSLQPSGGH